jgi:hypothetical protein
MGGRWSWRTVRDIARRLGFPHRVAYVPTKLLQARVQGVWKQHHGWTPQQLLSKLGLEYPLGIVRAWAVVKWSRESAAKHHWPQRRIGWPVDRYTMTRIRISEIWKWHTEFSARW